MIELLQVVQGRAEVPKFLGATRPERAEAPSPGQRPGYKSQSARRPVRAKALLIA